MVAHNNQIANAHFKKDWQGNTTSCRVRTWFNQAGRYVDPATSAEAPCRRLPHPALAFAASPGPDGRVDAFEATIETARAPRDGALRFRASRPSASLARRRRRVVALAATARGEKLGLGPFSPTRLDRLADPPPPPRSVSHRKVSSHRSREEGGAAATRGPAPTAGALRPVVRPQTQRYNFKTRASRPRVHPRGAQGGGHLQEARAHDRDRRRPPPPQPQRGVPGA